MRITENMTLSAALRGQTQAARRMNDATRVASTGQRVNAPSEDAVAWSTAVGHDARIQRMEGRLQTHGRVGGDLDLAESSLASAEDLMVRAREIAVQGATGTLDTRARADLGRQVNDIRTAMIALADTRGATGYLFGGTRTDAAPFDSAGVFSGNDVETRVEIADGVTARSNASGARAFTAAGGRDIFADLQTLANALTTDDVLTVRSSLTSIDAGHAQLVTARVETGLASERFRTASEVTSNALLHTQMARASEVEADLPTAISDLSTTRAAFERGISVTREILQTLSQGR
jgi:flagellar hook-associated protein 3 FlgL